MLLDIHSAIGLICIKHHFLLNFSLGAHMTYGATKLYGRKHYELVRVNVKLQITICADGKISANHS